MYRAVLADHLLRPYLFGSGASAVGDAAALLGFLLVVQQATGSAAQVSGIALAEAAPYLAFGLLGGAISDRLPRLPLIIGIDVIRGVMQCGVCLLVATGNAPYPVLVVAVALLQLGGCFVNPARRALLPDLTSEALLPTANAVLSTAQTGAALIAPVCAVAIITTTGPAAFFALDAASYLASAASAALLARRWKQPPRGPAGQDGTAEPASASHARLRGAIRRTVGDLRGFWTMIAGHRELRSLLIGTALVVLATTWARMIGMLLLAAPHDPSGQLFSLLTAVIAAAGLVAGLLLPLLVGRPNLPTYTLGALIWGIGIGIAVLPFGPLALFVGAAAQGVGFAVTNAARSYVLQTRLESGERGQGFAAAATALYLADVASIALFGILTVIVDTKTLMVAAAVATCAAAALTWAATRSGRKMTSEIDRRLPAA